MFFGLIGEENISKVNANLLVYNPATWAEWTKGTGVTGDITGLELTSTVSVYVNASMANLNTKINTKHGVLYNVVSKDIVSNLNLTKICGADAVMPSIIGNNKYVFASTSNTILVKTFQVFIYEASSGLKIKLKDIRLFELPVGSQIESDFNTMTADQLNIKYPF